MTQQPNTTPAVLTCIERKIKQLLKRAPLPEEVVHSENTLHWLLRLCPRADAALRIAAQGHDLDRSAGQARVRREDYEDYDLFKQAHARNSARLLREIMAHCGASQPLIREVHRLVCLHETGGDERADLLKDADSLSYFDVNLPHYFEREGYEETLRRSIWGYRRLSSKARDELRRVAYASEILNQLLGEVIRSGRIKGK
jgi:hypothetical protein